MQSFFKSFTPPSRCLEGEHRKCELKRCCHSPLSLCQAVLFRSFALAAVNQRNIQQFIMRYISQLLLPLFTCSFPLLNCKLVVNNHVVLPPTFFTDNVGSSWLLQIRQQMAPEFNNCPTRCDLFNLLHFCRQLYMFRVMTPIIRSSYNCNYNCTSS